MHVNGNDGNTTDGCISKSQHTEYVIGSPHEIVAHMLIMYINAYHTFYGALGDRAKRKLKVLLNYFYYTRTN